jgi:quercetin dioxygenase-like cupin family protein
MPETIKMGALTLNFLRSKDETGGSLDMFEMIAQPNGRMPVSHYHESWDEAIFGLSGTMTFRVDGKDFAVTPGETVFIPRGIVHGFTNNSGALASCLCTLTPGVLGPGYFHEIAAALGGEAPDPAKMKDIMLRHGLIPVAAA